MRWHVEAADVRTGRDTVLTIEALTQADAERMARYNGLLVSSVRKAGVGETPAPVVAYARPRDEEAAEGETEEAARLGRRARATERLGVAVSVVGWAALVGGAVVFGYVALRAGWGDWRDWRAWAVPAGWRGGGWMMGGAVGVVAGSVMRLLAAMGMVMRANAPGAGARGEGVCAVVRAGGGGVDAA